MINIKKVFKKIYFRDWQYQSLGKSKSYDFVFDKISIAEKIKQWILLSKYLEESFKKNKINLVGYPKEITNKIKLNVNIETKDEKFLDYYSTLSYYDSEFIKQFVSSNKKIIEISTGFGRMLPFFIDYKNYSSYEPIKKISELSEFFIKNILKNNFKILKTEFDLTNTDKVDLYYSIDCLGEISTKQFVNYMNIFKKNLNKNGIILIRDWWWNKDNLKFLLKQNDYFHISKTKIKYIDVGENNNWYILKIKNV